MIRKEFTVKEDEESYKLNKEELDNEEDEEDDEESIK